MYINVPSGTWHRVITQYILNGMCLNLFLFWNHYSNITDISQIKRFGKSDSFQQVNSKPSFYEYHIKITWYFDQFQENASEGTAPPEDVFKKPLPPTVKKEESPPPVRLSWCAGLGLGLIANGKEGSKVDDSLRYYWSCSSLCLTGKDSSWV